MPSQVNIGKTLTDLGYDTKSKPKEAMQLQHAYRTFISNYKTFDSKGNKVTGLSLWESTNKCEEHLKTMVAAFLDHGNGERFWPEMFVGNRERLETGLQAAFGQYCRNKHVNDKKAQNAFALKKAQKAISRPISKGSSPFKPGLPSKPSTVTNSSPTKTISPCPGFQSTSTSMSTMASDLVSPSKATTLLPPKTVSPTKKPLLAEISSPTTSFLAATGPETFNGPEDEQKPQSEEKRDEVSALKATVITPREPHMEGPQPAGFNVQLAGTDYGSHEALANRPFAGTVTGRALESQCDGPLGAFFRFKFIASAEGQPRQSRMWYPKSTFWSMNFHEMRDNLPLHADDKVYGIHLHMHGRGVHVEEDIFFDMPVDSVFEECKAEFCRSVRTPLDMNEGNWYTIEIRPIWHQVSKGIKREPMPYASMAP